MLPTENLENTNVLNILFALVNKYGFHFVFVRFLGRFNRSRVIETHKTFVFLRQFINITSAYRKIIYTSF